MIQSSEVIRITEWLQGFAKQHHTGEASIDSNIDLKLNHSLRVAQEAKSIAKSLNLSDSDINLAQICGILHDVGRFRQYKIYQTFVDSQSVYHGTMGVDVLNMVNVLDKFDMKTVNIIHAAVYNHGLIAIEEGLPERELLFSKITRDADKIDIYRIVTLYYHQSDNRNSALELGLTREEIIDNAVLEDFATGKVVEKTDLKSLNDFKVLQLSWINDINYGFTAKTIAERNFLNQIVNSIEGEENRNLIAKILKTKLDKM
ncbi:MAG: HD domain-containing protein [Bacteroidales bacterium]|nr:HD domain-containing protein [Bacteroidales bacterium]